MHGHDWLFPQNFDTVIDGKEVSGPVGSEDYINHFARKHKLFLMRLPSPYRFSYLKENKDRVALSSHVVSGGAVLPYTIIQYHEKKHVIGDWVYDAREETFMFSLSLFINDQRDYHKFMLENVAHQHKMSEDVMGFAQGTSVND